jgi:ribosomal protein L37E
LHKTAGGQKGEAGEREVATSSRNCATQSVRQAEKTCVHCRFGYTEQSEGQNKTETEQNNYIMP